MPSTLNKNSLGFMFAVIKEGAKQYLVKEKDIIAVEKRPGEIGGIMTFSDVMWSDGKGSKSSVLKVTAKILEHKKAEKVITFKKKRRQNYQRTKGHRQEITILQIDKISEE